MDIMAILGIVSTSMQIARDPNVQNLIHGGIKEITPSKINAVIPSAEQALATFGAWLSPKSNKTAQAAIGLLAAATNGSTLAEQEQQKLNAYLAGYQGFVPLVVDGKLGPKTHDAIILAQTKGGIQVDGWLGKDTAKLIGLPLT